MAGIHADDVQAQALVVLHHILELILAQHAVVHEDTRQLVADGAVEQDGTDGAVHAAGESEDDVVLANLLAQLGDGGVHEVGRRPVLPAAADVDHEVLQEQRALQGVEHLGVELHAPDGFGVGGIGCVLHLFGAGYGVEAFGQSRDGVAVAHPHLAVLLEAVEERVVEVDGREVGAPVFAAAGGLHLAAQRVTHELSAVADAQDGHASAELAEVDAEGFGVVDAVGRACQDDADDVGVAHGELVVGQNLAESVELAQAAGYELGRLRTEVQDDDFLLLHILYI